MRTTTHLACFLAAMLLGGSLLGGQNPAPPQPSDASPISLHLEGADLLQVVGIIATELKMNYVVDPQVKGTVMINTTGEVKREDLLPLLQAVLRMNGATAVQTGNMWRIVTLKDAPRLPVSPQVDNRDLPADDRLMLNVVPLRFVSAGDMGKILAPYLSDAGNMVVHEAGNVLLLLDTSRSLRRLMELLIIFDSDAFSGQRVRLFPVTNSSAKDLVGDLQSVFAAYALSEKSALRFVPIERINSLLVVSPNPGSFPEVEKWITRLDQATRTAGIRNYVYKVENARAGDLVMILTQLYGGSSTEVGGNKDSKSPQQQAGGPPPLAANAAPAAPTRLVGTQLGAGPEHGGSRFVADSVNNMVILQATPPEWEEIHATLRELDVLPRQVLIEAQIFEVNLSGALSMGVSAFLRSRSDFNRTAVGTFSPDGGAASIAGGVSSPVGINGSVGMLIGQTRELLLFLNAQENRSKTRVISAPSILASDNTGARIQVGSEIPILTSVGFTGAQQQGGGSIFTNSISNKDTGVILDVHPRINAGGLVTLQVNQEVSVPTGPASAQIPSPSIQKRSITTQVTVKDGQTIALGGIIAETDLTSRTRVPILGDIPYLGVLFGNTSVSHQRTELIVLLTPRVIRDLSDANEMTEELKTKLKGLKKLMQTP